MTWSEDESRKFLYCRSEQEYLAPPMVAAEQETIEEIHWLFFGEVDAFVFEGVTSCEKRGVHHQVVYRRKSDEKIKRRFNVIRRIVEQGRGLKTEWEVYPDSIAQTAGTRISH